MTNVEKQHDAVEGTKPTKRRSRTTRITLHSEGAKLVLMAQSRPSGEATTYAATTDLTTKKTTRGMTKHHTTFDAAALELGAMLRNAQKIGWQKSVRKGFTAKPDAFSTMPAPKLKKK